MLTRNEVKFQHFNSILCLNLYLKISVKIAQLASNYRNCEVNFQNGNLTIFGFKEEVLKAKNDVNSFLVDKMLKKNSEIEEKMNVCKDVQWLFEIKKDDWKSFPLYVNSIIETAFLKKLSHVCL